MVRLTPYLLLAAVVAIGATKTQTSKDARFSEYKTYQWLPPRILTKQGLIENDDVVAPVIRKAIDRELAKQGLTQVAQGGDLQVSTLALRESVPQLEAIIYPAGQDWGLGPPITTIGRYNHEGTLAINLIDASTKHSAWMAISTDTFDNMNQLDEKVNKAVDKMFSKYPKPKK